MVIDRQKRLQLLKAQQEAVQAVWYDNVPTKGQNPSRQYPLIASNFQCIKEANNANHVDMKDQKKRGLHTRIDMLPFDENPPALECTPAFATLFAKKDCKLYYRSQCSNTIIDLIGEFSGDQKGYHKFSTGFMIQWDTTSAFNNSPISFRMPFPVKCLGVVAQLYRNDNSVRSLFVKKSNITNASWVPLTNATSGTTIFYIAIGW